MQERPIPLHSEEVLAILSGRMTQLRRPVKIAKKLAELFHMQRIEWQRNFFDNLLEEEMLVCPFGQPGDLLWVRETFCLDDNLNDNAKLVYRADRFARWFDDGPVGDPFYHGSEWEPKSKWKPSIHMPRWASRIDLDVTGVHVDRLQDMTPGDALLEGVKVNECEHTWSDPAWGCTDCMNTGLASDPRWVFESLWNSAYAKEGLGWDVNPWVWVVGFRRVKP